MKKNILAIAIASAVAAPVAFADAPTVYGQFNAAIDSVSVDGGSNDMDVVSRNSRVGVKGSEDLGNGLKAVYQFETTVNVAGGNNANGGFGGMRNTFVGVGGGFGTVVMGRHDSPLRMIQPNDGFADSAAAGNNTSTFNGGFAGEDRLDEVVAYISPNFNGISLMAAVSGQTALAEPGEDQSIANAMSASLSYGSKSKGIYAAVALTSTGKSTKAAKAPTYDPITGLVTAVGTAESTTERGDITRAVVQYNEAGLLASFMYNAQADVGSSMTAGVAYKMGALTPRAKVSMISYDAAGATDSMNMAAGVDYSLGKNSRVYAEFASLSEDNVGANTTVMSVGLFHKF